MPKITCTAFSLLLLLFLGNSSGNYAAQSKQKSSDASTGTLQKMIVESGSVTMRLDLNRLNEISSIERPATLHFATAANSFFSILVFNDQLRGPEPGSIALVAEAQPAPRLPASLAASLKQLVVEKFSPDAPFDFAVRDAKTGFTFFKIEGHQYDYQANARLLSITGGRLVISKEFAESLGRAADADAVVGEISIGATMQPVEITRLDKNGDVKSATLPALHQPGVGTVPGPDVIIGELIGLEQLDSGAVNGRVGHLFGNRCLQQGDGGRGLVCVAERRPSLYSAECLPNEWRR